jgi:uncharacterized protein (TIGR03437 family)
MNLRVVLSIPLIVLALALPVRSQTSLSIRIATDPPGARFTVDGQTYYTATNFLWPRGSKHVVSVVSTNFNTPNGGTICDVPASDDPVQYEPHCRARYGFNAWKTNGTVELAGAASLTQAITVDGSFTSLTATFALEYRIEMAMQQSASGPTSACQAKADRPGPPPRAGESIGIVFFGGDCFDFGATLWRAPGTYSLQAMPLTGYAFDGWVLDGVVYPSVTSYTVRGPATLLPRFLPAKRITFFTDPMELKVRVDRTEIPTKDPGDNNPVYPTPGVYDWVPGSKHILGAPSPQLDRESGRMYVFHSWSNGGGQDMVYTPDSEVATPVTLIAKFVRGANVSFFTEPKGLKLKIDGRENWLSYGFTWGLGSKYEFSAPAEQTDANGRKWRFKGWKHGGDATQEITIDQQAVEGPGVIYTAVYEAVPQLTLRSSIPGVTVRVDGSPCAMPCVLDRPAGTQIRVSVPERVTASEVARHDFISWSDGATAERTVAFDAQTIELRAMYRQSYRLLSTIDPPQGATLIAEPPSADGFYEAGTPVALALDVKPGYRFRRWEGDLTGTNPSGVVGMSGPRIIQALLLQTEQPASATVRNSAGETPVSGVAAGSIISILGAGLSPVTQSGPANPLAQSVGGVAVTVGDRILPLLFVSPEQVNALLPSDLPEAEYRLSVRPTGMKEVSTTFTVVRNAPGLLTTTTESGPIAVALREDGSAISDTNRAKAGEVVTLLGTGFGPYDRPVLDGFAVPANPRYTLADPIEVRIGDATVRPEWAGAAPGLTGVAAARFRIPADARGTRIALVIVNGVESNAVPIPVE